MAEAFQSVRPKLYARFRDLLRVGNTVSRMEVRPSVQPISIVSGLSGGFPIYDQFDVDVAIAPSGGGVLASITVEKDGIYDIWGIVANNDLCTPDGSIRLRTAIGGVGGNEIAVGQIRATSQTENRIYQCAIEIMAGQSIQFCNITNLTAGTLYTSLAVGRR